MKHSAQFIPLASLLEDHYLPSGEGASHNDKTRRIRQTLMWLRLFMRRNPTVADLTKWRATDFFRFLLSRGMARKTVIHHRQRLMHLWRFAKSKGLVNRFPDPFPPVPTSGSRRAPAEPGTLEHYFRYSYLPRDRRAKKREKEFLRALERLELFYGRPPLVEEITKAKLQEFREWIRELPRCGMQASQHNVTTVLRILEDASPARFPKPERKNDRSICEPLPGTLRHFFEETYRPLKLVGTSPATAVTYRASLDCFERFSGRELPIDQVTDALLARYFEQRLKDGRSRASINRDRRTLLAVLRFAKRRGVIESLPDVEPMRELRREPEAWTLDEFERILKAAGETPGVVGECIDAGDWWPALILTVYNTGARISAVMGLPTANFDLDQATLLIPAEIQKQKADQRFDLLPGTVAALRRISPGVHPCMFDDWPYDRNFSQWPALNAGLRDILARADLPATRRDLWHKIRRTFATYVASHAGEAVASSMLGHSCLSVTRRYLDRRMMQDPTVKDVLPDLKQKRKGPDDQAA